jgi:hypothetical protein
MSFSLLSFCEQIKGKHFHTSRGRSHPSLGGGPATPKGKKIIIIKRKNWSKAFGGGPTTPKGLGKPPPTTGMGVDEATPCP